MASSRVRVRWGALLVIACCDRGFEFLEAFLVVIEAALLFGSMLSSAGSSGFW